MITNLCRAMNELGNVSWGVPAMSWIDLRDWPVHDDLPPVVSRVVPLILVILLFVDKQDP